MWFNDFDTPSIAKSREKFWILVCGLVLVFSLLDLMARLILEDLSTFTLDGFIFGLMGLILVKLGMKSRFFVFALFVITLQLGAFYNIYIHGLNLFDPMLLTRPILFIWIIFSLFPRKFSLILSLFYVVGIHTILYFSYRKFSLPITIPEIFNGKLIVSSILNTIFFISALFYYRLLRDFAELNYNKQISSFYRFNSSLIHDLNNHITTLLGQLELLNYSPSATHFIKLRKTINELTSFSKTMNKLLQSGDFKNIQFSEIPLSSLKEKQEILFQSRLEEKKLNLVYDTNWNQNFVLHTNEELLSVSILGNILSNIIKFSSPGSHIYMSAHKNKEMAWLSIRDEAGGIPQEKINCIMKGKDFVESTEGTNREEGHGYGLAIIKYYCDVLSIELGIESNNQGTNFNLKFSR